MDVANAERFLIERFDVESFRLGVSAHIGALMHQATEGRWGYSIDFVTFEQEGRADVSFVGAGLVDLLNQDRVVPISVSIRLSADRKAIEEGEIKVGVKSANHPTYGSNDENLKRKFRFVPPRPIDWAFVFTRRSGAWSVANEVQHASRPH